MTVQRIALLGALLYALVWTSAAFAQDDNTTFGLKNGRYWTGTLPSIALSQHGTALFYQTALLAGIVEGWNLRNSEDESGARGGTRSRAMQPGADIYFYELAAMVNDVYNQPENLSLPIGWVIMAGFAVQRGDTSRDVVLGVLRKHLADLSAGKIPMSELSPIESILSVSRTDSPPR